MKKILLLLLACIVLPGIWSSPFAGTATAQSSYVEDQGYSFLISKSPSATAWGDTVHWYKIKTTRGAWLRANSGTDVDMVAAEPAPYDTMALWCVTGNSTDGYSFYNRGKGPGLMVTYDAVADNKKAVMAATGTYTQFIIGTSTAATNSYTFHYGDHCYFNNRANKLSTWNDARGVNDDGSSLLFTEVTEEEMVQLDSITYTIDKLNGDQYRVINNTTTVNDSYNMYWSSTANPHLTFGTTANNMQWSDNDVLIYSGSGGCTYTLTPPSGYVIYDYTFEVVNSGHSEAQTITMDDGRVITTGAEVIPVTMVGKNLSTVSFALSGSNKAVKVTNFVVKVKLDKPEKPIISTTDAEHWYYITNASTQTYCAGKVMNYDESIDRMRFTDKAYKPDRLWSFWEQDGKLAIKNYRGEYIGTAGSGTGGATKFGKSDTPNYIYTIEDAYGFFIIKDSAVELHAQEAGAVIVRWPAAEGGASLWRFDEVDMSHPEAQLSSIAVKQGKVTTGIGNKDQGIVRTAFSVVGLRDSVEVQSITAKVVATDLADVKTVKAYFATNDRELFVDADSLMTWREQNGELFGVAESVADDGTFTITGSKKLAPGEGYLWIAYDIAEDATEGHTVDAQVLSYVIDGETVNEANGNPANAVTIFLSEGAALMPYDCGSRYYRIPAITTVKKTLDNGEVVDRLVVLTDDRLQHNGDLPNQLYIVAQYSDDLGKSWTAPVRVAGTAERGGAYGHGDASIVTDRTNGNIIGIMTCAGTYGHGFWNSTAAQPQLWKTIKSTDGGETWELPVDHTSSLYGEGSPNPTWTAGFSGSGAALQKRDGTLVSSFVNRQTENGVTSQNFYFFMSEDGGDTWAVRGTSGTTRADEPKTLERNNGDLSIFVRAGGYNFHNVTSDDGETWHYAPETRFTTGISGNACDGEYMVWCSTLDGNPWNIALETLPNSGSRQNVSICLSTDEGETFGTPKTICPWGSGYSTCVVLPDGTLGVYYEEDGYYNASNYVLRFVRFSLDWASDGAYKFTEDSPFHPICEQQADAIEGMQTINTPADDVIYDLQGRRVVNPTFQGVYIKNGKTVIMK